MKPPGRVQSSPLLAPWQSLLLCSQPRLGIAEAQASGFDCRVRVGGGNIPSLPCPANVSGAALRWALLAGKELQQGRPKRAGRVWVVGQEEARPCVLKKKADSRRSTITSTKGPLELNHPGTKAPMNAFPHVLPEVWTGCCSSLYRDTHTGLNIRKSESAS